MVTLTLSQYIFNFVGKALEKEEGPKFCLRCPPKMMSFSQLAAVKKTSFPAILISLGLYQSNDILGGHFIFGPSYFVLALGLRAIVMSKSIKAHRRLKENLLTCTAIFAN